MKPSRIDVSKVLAIVHVRACAIQGLFFLAISHINLNETPAGSLLFSEIWCCISTHGTCCTTSEEREGIAVVPMVGG